MQHFSLLGSFISYKENVNKVPGVRISNGGNNFSLRKRRHDVLGGKTEEWVTRLNSENDFYIFKLGLSQLKTVRYSAYLRTIGQTGGWTDAGRERLNGKKASMKTERQMERQIRRQDGM